MKGIGVIEAPSNLYPNYARNSSSSSSSTNTFITNSYYNKSSSASGCSCYYMNLSFPTTPPTTNLHHHTFTTCRRRRRRRRRSFSTTTIGGVTFLRNNNNTTTLCSSSSSLALTSNFQDSSSSSSSFIVVNFYRFVFIDNPHHLVSTHLSFLQDEGLGIHGRIYLNQQGINAQYSAPSADALTYLHWIKQDCRFSDVFVQISPAKNEHSFPRLKLRYKPSLVQLEGGISHLPLLDPSMRAIPLAPSEWRNRLQATNNVENQKAIVLDVRNGYEWDIGHFRGAQRPDVDCFRSTSFGLSDSELTSLDPLASVDKGKTDILMYCTGGIRCDIYSSILRQRGFQNLFTLKGGVSHYLQKEGPVEWIGNLFVFDSRLSLPPSSYNPQAMTSGDKSQLGSEDSTFARCYICQSCLSELRHRNCANLDCNRLFLCCSKCVMEVRGCCCLDCTCAPRLRPILPRHQRYEKWHTYRDADRQNKSVV